MSVFLRPRLLPMTMSVGALLLGTKLVTLGISLASGFPDVAPSMVGPAAAAPASEKSSQAVAAPSPSAGTTAAGPVPELPSEAPLAPPPPAVSEAERQLLQDLRSRRQELDAREHTLAEREGVLDAAEQRLNTRVSQLAELQAKLEQLEAQRQQHDEANWAGLVKIYETMKPRDAATIFNDMDMPVLLQVVDRMRETKVAPILAAMLPDRARLVTSQLAAQRTRTLELSPTRPNAG